MHSNDRRGSRTGDELAKLGMARAHASALKVDPDWLESVYDALWTVQATGHTFTSETLWDKVGKPIGADPRAMGAALRWFATRGLIRPTGEVVKARNSSRHGGLSRVWRGTTHAGGQVTNTWRTRRSTPAVARAQEQE